MFAFGHSKNHMIRRQLGRLEPTPYLQVPSGRGHAAPASLVNPKKLEDRVKGFAIPSQLRYSQNTQLQVSSGLDPLQKLDSSVFTSKGIRNGDDSANL
jgi:hypothetical protein